jgi:surfeit locus 1 family protein
LLTVAGVAAGIRLGLWQTDRAQQKLQLMAVMQQRAAAPAIHVGPDPMAAGDLEYRTVEARGEFDPKGLVLLDNRVHEGRVGYEVVMPLRIAGSSDMYLLVDRGWVAGTGDRTRLPEISTPRGEVSVVGLAVIPGQKMFELSPSQAIEGSVWQNLTIERYVTHMPYKIQPVLVQQTNEAQDGLLRAWSISDREVNVHRSYALQWFALAGLVFVVFLFMSFKRDASNT